MSNKLFFGFLFCRFISDSFCGQYERELLNDLLQDYQPYERPVFSESLAVDVKHGLTFQQLVELDIDKQILTSVCWQNIQWNDVNLRWNESDYGGINDIRLPSDRIWIPDIIPYNALDYNNADPRKQITNIVISSDGDCIWPIPVLMRTTCKIDYTAYRQTCDIKFGSWTYDGFKMNLTLIDSSADISGFVRNHEWELISADAKRNLIKYECCPETYLDITYKIIFERRG